MSDKGYRTLQALVIAVLGLFFIFKIYDGRILLYINQRFLPLILAAAVGFLILSQVVLKSIPTHSVDLSNETHPHQHNERAPLWVLWLMVLPVLISLFIPEKPLGASAVETRGINSLSPLSQSQSSLAVLDVPPEQRNILEWIRFFQSEEGVVKAAGEKADITGFVFHDPRLPLNQVMIGRFTITCCVADAVALGIVVEKEGVDQIDSNAWARVRGIVTVIEENGKQKPVIRAESIEIIPEPAQPYLFP